MKSNFAIIKQALSFICLSFTTNCYLCFHRTTNIPVGEFNLNFSYELHNCLTIQFLETIAQSFVLDIFVFCCLVFGIGLSNKYWSTKTQDGSKIYVPKKTFFFDV